MSGRRWAAEPPDDSAWPRWLLRRVPLIALTGALFGVLTVYGPLRDQPPANGPVRVLLAGLFFGCFMLITVGAEEWWRRRRRTRSD